jgi:hypothetical protein
MKTPHVPNHLYMLFKALSLEPEGFQFAERVAENGASVSSVVKLRASVCRKWGL